MSPSSWLRGGHWVATSRRCGERSKRRKAARRSTLLQVERLEDRSLLAAAPAGLMSWYRAEGNALDFAGDNDGALLNGATFTAGKVGQAFFFDGTDDQVSVPDSAGQNPGSNFTVEAWVNLTSSGHGRTIAQKRSSSNVGGYTLETSHDIGPNGLQFVVWFGGSPHFLRTPAGVLENGTWQHVAATYDGTALRIFVDGTEKASALASGTIDATNDPVVIGQNAVIASFAWHGAIDEVSFYNRALSSAELQTIVAAGSEGKQPAIVVNTTADTIDVDGGITSLREAILASNASVGVLDTISFNIPGPSTAGLVSAYRGEGNANDAIGGNHGTLQNGPGFTAGRYGQAFDFDGVDDSVDLGDWYNLQTFTIDMWVKPGATQAPYANIIDNNHTDFRGWVIQQNASNLNQYVWGVQDGSTSSPTFNLTADVWHHVAVTHDGPSRVSNAYVNGLLVGTVTGTKDIVYDGAPFLRLARWGGGARNWNGELDEVGVFSRVLSAAEVQAIATSPRTITAAVATISPASALPAITDPVIIDGYTQPGASPNTLADGNNAVILVELEGTNAGAASGLTIRGGGSTIRGLAINGFAGSGIVLQSSDNIVAGNFLGTDVTGAFDRGNGAEGVTIVGSAESDAFYSNDFESGVGEEWNVGATELTPAGSRRFLGQFGSETATLTLPAGSIPSGTTALALAFDLFVIRTWDGNHTGSGSGPDRFTLSLGNGLSLLDTTFSNNVSNSGFAGQAYPGTFGSGQFVPLSGAAETDTLGYEFGEPMDSVYRVTRTFSYTGGDLALDFTGLLTTPGADESWGLDNVELRAITGGYSAANDYSLSGNPNGTWTYGWTSSQGSSLHPYPHGSIFRDGQLWTDNAIKQNESPHTFYNPTDTVIDAPRHLPGQLAFHPGPAAERSVIRWTAPASAKVLVSALFTGADFSTTSDVHVLHNGVSLFDGLVSRLHAGPYFSTTLDVVSGDAVDFVVGDGGNGYLGDSTALDAVITSVSSGAAVGNVIGGTSPAAQNIVAFSGGDGIRTTGENIAVAIVGNSIFANGASGIDLDDENITPPVILSLTSLPADLAIAGSLAGNASASYRVEFFGSDTPDLSGFGEGQRLLGVRVVTTDSSGHSEYSHALPPVLAGLWITATATLFDPAGERLLQTSEFSAAVQALPAVVDVKADLEVTINDSPDPVILGQSVTYTVTATNNGPASATGVVVVALGPAGQQFNSLTIPLGELASGAASSFQAVFTPLALGNFSVTATVYASEEDPNPANNIFTATTLVRPNVSIELSQAQYEIREGEEFVVLTVRKTGDVAASGSVEFETLNGTAGQRGIGGGPTRIADFTTTSGTLFFRSRQTVATIRIPIGDDGILEVDETFRVVLSSPSVNAELGAIASAEVVIHDNDPTISFVAGSSERNEGSGGRAAIEVRLQPASNKTVTVSYATAGGTATLGSDYTLLGRALTFRPGETRKFIQFSTINDTRYEGSETAFIKLTATTNAFLGATARHRVTLIDNDPVPPPVDPGSTIGTALAIDLATLPRQAYWQHLTKSDVDTFKVELGPLERLALDVDPSNFTPGLPALPNSKLRIMRENGQTLVIIGASAEPETGQTTNNAAHLLQADADGGTYYIQLTTTGTAKSYGYSLGFHRLGVSEIVPSPDKLAASGPMYAWYDGDETVGITGPTGYGFTLVGPWRHEATAFRRTVLSSQTLTMPRGSHFVLKSPQGVEMPLIANGAVSITTKSQRWGNLFGVVDVDAIKFPVAIDIVPLNNVLASAFGSQFATAGLLGGEWRISLGGRAFNLFGGFGTGIEATEIVDQLLPGVPYLRKFEQSVVDAHIGGFRLSQLTQPTPLNWIFDPADPMLFVKIPSGPGVAGSKHGLLRFQPEDLPDGSVEAGFTEFAGHIYANATIPLPVPGFPMSLGADLVINVDADRDGKPLGDLADIGQLGALLAGDPAEVREILRDIQIGGNGRLNVSAPVESPIIQSLLTLELARASVVLNGLAETVWLRGEFQGRAFNGTSVELADSSVLMEGLIDFGTNEFLYIQRVTSDSTGIELGYDFRISNDGVSLRVFGGEEWSVKIDTSVGRVSGKATVSFEAMVAIEIDDDGDVHLAGSVSASGTLKARIAGENVTLFSDSVDAKVRSRGLRFRFPRGVGELDLDLF